MSNTFGYHMPGTIRNYKCLRAVTLWAGGLGVVQSLIWMALTIVGIIAYNCILDVDETLTFGSLVPIVFFKLYFEGDCPADENDYTILKSVQTILDPTQVLTWTCVYLAITVCWLLASVLLLANIKKDDVKLTVGILYTWVFVTLAICLMDLALGIIFGIDYGQFSAKAYDYNLNSVNAGEIIPDASQLVAGMITSVSLMIISLKGFVLWIMNVGLVIYLLMRAICIACDKDGNDTLFMPRKDSDDILTTRPPINAYEEQKSPQMAYSNEAFVPDNRSVATVELNQEPIARAARMSTDASLQDRRFRNLEAFQQYPPPRSNTNRPESVQQQESVVSANITVASYPAPDYSPPMSRASHNQSGLARNQRFQ